MAKLIPIETYKGKVLISKDLADSIAYVDTLSVKDHQVRILFHPALGIDSLVLDTSVENVYTALKGDE